MAKTSTERQHDYLARRRAGLVDEQRIYAWLPRQVVEQLDTLALRAGNVSRREVLVRLISSAAGAEQ